MYIEINALHFPYDELRPLVCQDSSREQLQQNLNLKYFLFTMDDTSPHSSNKLTEEQIEKLIKRLRGVEHIEPIEDSNVNNEKMATFAEVVNNQSSNKTIQTNLIVNTGNKIKITHLVIQQSPYF